MNFPLTFRRLFAFVSCLLCLAVFHPLNAQKLEGIASFYGKGFDGKPTSTGETFRKSGYTAASLDLPWGTIVEVTNLDNGKTVQVRVNDCGPHTRGRIIDVTRQAATELDFIKAGEAKVRLRILQTSESGPTCSRGAWSRKLKAQGKSIPPPPAPWDPTVTAKLTPVGLVVATSPAANPAASAVKPAAPAANPAAPVPQGSMRGLASFYAERFHGLSTSTGEIYDRSKLTAASKAFPYGTMLEVTNITSGAKVTVKVNDCGPANQDRIMDLSRAAAEQIGLVRAGMAMVDLKVLSLGTQGPTCNRKEWAMAVAQANAATPKPVSAVIATTLPKGPASAAPAPVSAQPENLVTAFQNQVGAFSQYANALDLVGKLDKDGFAKPYMVNDGKVVRVFTGLSASEAGAVVVQQALLQRGYPKSTIVETKVAAEELGTSAAAPAPGTYGGGVMTPTQASAAAPATKAYDPDAVLFGVQVGAFGNKSNADKAMTGLRAAGFQEVYSARVGETYRVFSGKFYFQSQADVEKEKVRVAGFTGAAVRRVQ
jgi:rare lipoprotein A